jgi:hypothetical protein
VVLLVNPVPVTVRVVEAAPAVTMAGLTEETVGLTATGTTGVEPPPLPELSEPDVQPV